MSTLNNNNSALNRIIDSIPKEDRDLIDKENEEKFQKLLNSNEEINIWGGPKLDTGSFWEKIGLNVRQSIYSIIDILIK